MSVSFDHGTARPVDGLPPDMHRHRHVLCWNATFDAVENRIKAGQLGNIVRDKGYYEAAFYARLAHKVEALGYGIDRRGGKEWEIAGVPQSVIDKFNKRTDQIETEAERLGITDAKRKAGLGAKVRAKKQKELSMPQLRLAWDGQLTEGEREAMAAVYRRSDASAPAVTPTEAVAFAIAHCSEQLSVIPERELKRVALLHGLGSVLPEQVTAELPKHGLIVQAIDGRRMATTRTLIDEERYLVGLAASGRGTVRPVGVADGLERGKANDGQWDNVLKLLNSRNRVNQVQGPAGAGKSFMLQKFDEGVRLAGQQATYLAMTTKAVEVLEEEGFAAHTLAHFLVDTRLQEAAKGGRVVIDESSLLGHKDALRLYRLAEKLDLTLIHVGDPYQHGAIGRGALMRILEEYGGITPFRLIEIMRQKDPDYRAAAELLSQGKAAQGLDAIAAKGWVKEIADADTRYQAMAAEYLHAIASGTRPNDLLMVSPTHVEAGRVTEAVRSQLRAAGKLETEEREFTRLVAVDSSVAERGLAVTYRAGDVIQFHQNAKGFRKGERVTVADSKRLPLNEAAKFQLYREAPIMLAVGDRIRFTGRVATTDGAHKTTNGAAHTVTGFTKAGGFILDNGWEMPADAGHFRHGFCETSVGAQGRTVRHCILAMSSASLGATNSEQMYVSSSRASEGMTLYTDDQALLRKAIQHSSRKLAALDLVPDARGTARQCQHRRRRVAAFDPVQPMEQLTKQPQPERQAGHGR